MRTMSLSEAKGKLKVGMRVEFNTIPCHYRGKITKIDDPLIYIDDETDDMLNNVVNINNITNLTLLDDEPDWRKGTAPIPREELRVGMRIKDKNGLVEKIIDVKNGWAKTESGLEWRALSDCHADGGDLYLVPSPDTEWHALTESNICDFLAVGDTVEVKWDGCNGNKIVTVDSFGGDFLCGPCREGGRYAINERGDNTQFRLIKKGTARSEAMPEIAEPEYTQEEIAAVAAVREKIKPIEVARVEETSWVKTPLEELFYTYTNTITKPPQGHNKLMQVVTNLMKTVANSLLKDEDKAMRAKGFQDDKGEDTGMFIEEVQARRLKADCDEFRAAITADVVKVWKEEQEKK